MKEVVAYRSFIVYTLDLLSIPQYVIKKGRPLGHRDGKAPENKKYYLVHNLKKRCIKRKFTGIHDRFLRDHVFRERMFENNRDEDVCRKWDDLAEQDHTCRITFTTGKIGGSLSVSQDTIPNHGENVLKRDRLRKRHVWQS